MHATNTLWGNTHDQPVCLPLTVTFDQKRRVYTVMLGYTVVCANGPDKWRCLTVDKTNNFLACDGPYPKVFSARQ